MALVKEGLWSIVSETENPPADDAADDIVAKYRSRKDRALATIVLSIEPALLYLIGNPTEPVVVWKKLQSQFQKKSWTNKLVLTCTSQTLLISSRGLNIYDRTACVRISCVINRGY